MKKHWTVRLGLVIVVIGALLSLGTLFLRCKLGYVVDWPAVLKMQPPIFKVQTRVVRVEYTDKETFVEEASKFWVGTDIWEIGDDYMIGVTTDPNIRKLRKAGFRVEILFQTIEDYVQFEENQQDATHW